MNIGQELPRNCSRRDSYKSQPVNQDIKKGNQCEATQKESKLAVPVSEHSGINHGLLLLL